MTRVVIRGFLFSQEIQQVKKVPQCLRRGVPKCVVLGCIDNDVVGVNVVLARSHIAMALVNGTLHVDI